MLEARPTRTTPATGVCHFCEASFAKSAMSRHLARCPVRLAQMAAADTAPGKAQKLFHLVVEGKYAKDYWLHLEMPGSAALADLDDFLRDIWLECCGHLSAFDINGEFYMSQPDMDFWTGQRDRSMKTRLDRALSEGTSAGYQYDFGSTTHLRLKVFRVRSGRPLEPGIVVMARNQPPEIRCDECGRPATQVSAGWGEGAWCDDCVDEGHGEGLLPVVNSPRCGVCAYTG